MEPKICPYLGLTDDPNTNTAFPYEDNACHRIKRPINVRLSHQRDFCLADEHISCPGYVDGWVNGFPDSIKAHPPIYKSILKNKRVWAALTVVILFTIYIIFNQQINAIGSHWGEFVASRFSRPTATGTDISTPNPTKTLIPPTQMESIQSTAVGTSTFTVTDTPAPTLTSTATETPTQVTEESSYRVEVITFALNIRSEPIYKINGSNIVDVLRSGDIVEVFEEQNGWLRTEKGWIKKIFTKVVD